MLDLIPLGKPDDILSYRYLEPACGNGNFLIEILRRKLARVNEKYVHKSVREFEFFIIKALTTIYGIDICADNVKEARQRLFTEVKSFFDTHKGSFLYSPGFLSLVDAVLETNIVVGDSINAPDEIYFTEYKFDKRMLVRSVFCFADLSQDKPQPINVLPAEHFLLIGLEREQKTGRQYESQQGYFNFI